MVSVSVIIPAFNSASTLHRCLLSVTGQTMKPHEIIVVDDGSTDETAHIITEFPEVKYIYQTNRGPSSARNTGAGFSSGSFLAFLDSDDYWTSDHIERLTSVLSDRNGLKWAAAPYFKMASDGKKSVVKLPGKYIKGSSTDYFYSTPKYHFLSAISVLLDRSSFIDAGGFPEKYFRGEDLSLWLRFAMKNPILGYSDKPTAIYTWTPGSLTDKKGNYEQLMQRVIDDYIWVKNQPVKSMDRAWPVMKRWVNGLIVKLALDYDNERLAVIRDTFAPAMGVFMNARVRFLIAVTKLMRRRNVQKMGI